MGSCSLPKNIVETREQMLKRDRGDPHFCGTLESLLKNYDSFQIVLTKSNAAFKLFVVSKKFER